MSGLSSFHSLLYAWILATLYLAQIVAADGGYHYCKLESDFSSREASLRTRIFQAEDFDAAIDLTSRELFSLGAGLRYNDDQTCLVVQSKNRRSDPDIVAFRALAFAAGKGADTERLARAIVLSFERECQCSLFTAKEQERLVWVFKEILDDPWQRKEIVEFGKEEEKHYSTSSPVQTSPRFYQGRRLMGNAPITTESSKRRLTVTEASPTNSLVCAHCDPPNQCREISWCR